MAKKKQLTPGDLYEINMNSLGLAFAVVTAGTDIAFFKAESVSEMIGNFEGAKFLFRAYVAQDGVTSKRWKKVGNVPLQSGLEKTQAYRHQPVGSNQLFRYENGVSTPAALAEVEALDPLVTWFQSHIEQRLSDCLQGKSNGAVEFLSKIKRYDPTSGFEIKQN